MDLNRLSSAEITNLWTHYIRESMAICVSKYALKNIEDTDIRSTFESALRISNNHIQKLKKFFTQEKFPIPNGFTDEDVNLKAPPLFTDNFWLMYIYGMTMHGSSLFSLAFNSSARQDLRDFYYKCVNDAMNLYNMSLDLLISKGLYEKSPYFSTPQKIDNIKNLSYVTDVVGKKRPLNSMESGNIYFNLKKSMLTKALVLGFSKVCKSNEIRKFMDTGLQVANKHIGLFSSLLIENDLHVPKLMDSEVTNSSIAPFSDKLMLFHTGSLFGIAISYYGYAGIMSMRADLLVHCETAILRISKFWRNLASL
ncbi:DUF3231 family protein [Cytobacillus praedii]|uniref:DUF3231 family protein n=1 Tax=Cytobacillus praedii TaxID=1742358 RepID=UPI0026D79C70